ncbi:MAG: methyltransferase domain-containing protein [Candidatus Woesearchaeota archaeon]
MIKKILVRTAKKQIVDEKERVIEKEKIYLIEDMSKDYHCSDGVFKKEDLKKTGIIKSSKGKEFYVIDASFIDSYKGIKKTSQTIPLKDLGFILAETGIDKSSIVIDAGSGSGGAACFFARYVKKVYSFDINQKNIEQSKRNAEYFGLNNIEFKEIDVYKEIPVKNADMVLLDLPEPWKALNTANMAIKSGGFIVTYCPQITQAQKFINESLNLLHIKIVEIIERDWNISGLIVKPKSLSNIHSGFIIISRKIK